eukprot:536332-Amphidinium_carterae.2
MGLQDKTEEVLAVARSSVNSDTGSTCHLSQQPEMARASPRPAPASASAATTTVLRTPSNENTPDVLTLPMRVKALEAWAHALDSQLAVDDDESTQAIVRAREILDVMAQQAIKDAQTERHDDLWQWAADRAEQIVSLSAKVDALFQGHHLGSAQQRDTNASREPVVERSDDRRIQLLEERIAQLQAEMQTFATVKKNADDLALKLLRVTHQVDLCFKLCRRGIVGAAQAPEQIVKKFQAKMEAADNQTQQISGLVRLNTTAMTRTWQWTASLVQASPVLSTTKVGPPMSQTSNSTAIPAECALVQTSIAEPAVVPLTSNPRADDVVEKVDNPLLHSEQAVSSSGPSTGEEVLATAAVDTVRSDGDSGDEMVASLLAGDARSQVGVVDRGDLAQESSADSDAVPLLVVSDTE